MPEKSKPEEIVYPDPVSVAEVILREATYEVERERAKADGRKEMRELALLFGIAVAVVAGGYGYIVGLSWLTVHHL